MLYDAFDNFEDFLAVVSPGCHIHEDGFSADDAKHRGGVHAVAHAQKKPWGGEVWHIFGDRIAMKTLFVSPNQRLSYQSHNLKEEAWIFQTKGWAIIEDQEIEFLPGAVVHIAPGRRHRLLAKDQSVVVIEASTHELMDVVRYEDDYGRERK